MRARHRRVIRAVLGLVAPHGQIRHPSARPSTTLISSLEAPPPGRLRVPARAPARPSSRAALGVPWPERPRLSKRAPAAPRRRRLMARLLRPAVPLLAAAFMAAPARAGNDDVRAVLERNGIRAVDPPIPAVDFLVPRTDGGSLSLSQARGHWVVLTFFATWCGPCASEMPSLERLHTSMAERGVQVLGVAIDGDMAAAKSFARQHRLSFLVGVDTDGKAASSYHASSVPTTYLVDPQGRVAGMARGARDWAAAAGMFSDLLALSPPDASAAPMYADNVALPPTLVPPTASVRLSDAQPRAGEAFALEVRIRWAGNFDDYLLHPPSVHLPASVHERRTSASTSTEQGDRVVTYTFELAADEAGAFALDPVELRYTPRGEKEPVSTRIAGPTVRVRALTIAGMPPAAFAGAVAAVLAAAALAWWLWRRRGRAREGAAGTPDGDTYTRLFSALETARGRRVAGDAAGFFLAAALIERELAEAGGEETVVRQLDQEIERVRYGGMVPSPEELERIQRRVERRLAALAPDPRAAERDSIRFADSRETTT